MVKLITALANGKVGKESFFYQAHEKYGPIVRLKSAGKHFPSWLIHLNLASYMHASTWRDQ